LVKDQGANKKSESSIKKQFSYDEWVKDNSNQYLFDNDLLSETYQYWENPTEKEARLRETWIRSKSKRLEINDSEEMEKLSDDIAGTVRDLRRKIDQHLIKNRKHPVFGSNYRNFTDEDLMLDSEIEFHKIKKFLQNEPGVIKQDPEIGYRYEELLKTLKRKKVIENSVPRFGAEQFDEYYNEKVKAESYESAEVQEDEGDDYVTQIGTLKEKMKTITTTFANPEELTASKSIGQVEEKIQKAKEKIIAEFEGLLDRENVKKVNKKTKEKKLAATNPRLAAKQLKKNKK
jgi:hypothetical protein